MSFELYDPALGSDPGAKVTVRKDGRLCFSATAQKLLGRCEYVLLYFDRQRGRIGIKAAKGDESQALRIYGYERANQRREVVVSCVPFLRFYGIFPDATRKYGASYEDGMLVVQVGEKASSDPLRIYRGGKAS